MRMHSDAMPPATISHCRQLSPMNADIKSSADMSDCDGTRTSFPNGFTCRASRQGSEGGRTV
jgi:hypothetical protein